MKCCVNLLLLLLFGGGSLFLGNSGLLALGTSLFGGSGLLLCTSLETVLFGILLELLLERCDGRLDVLLVRRELGVRHLDTLELSCSECHSASIVMRGQSLDLDINEINSPLRILVGFSFFIVADTF